MVYALMVGCGSIVPAPAETAVPIPSPARSQVIVLGNVDPDEPAKKIKRFRPLAEHLAGNLGEFGIIDGQVVVARSIEEMASFLNTGAVDIYFDSSFPTLRVRELSGSKIILRRWKQGDPEYWSLFVALKDSGIDSVRGFVGGVLAFEKPHSTSGFVLPAGTLVQRGFTLREVEGPMATVGSSEIGYYFSGDEENTIQLVLQGKVIGGGISNQDYDGLPEELKQRLVAIERTIVVPRQLVSVRPELQPETVEKIRNLLISLDRSVEGRQILRGLADTRKFDTLTSDSKAALEELKKLMGLVINE